MVTSWSCIMDYHWNSTPLPSIMRAGDLIKSAILCDTESRAGSYCPTPGKEAGPSGGGCSAQADRWPSHAFVSVWTDGAQRLESPAPAAAAGVASAASPCHGTWSRDWERGWARRWADWVHATWHLPLPGAAGLERVQGEGRGAGAGGELGGGEGGQECTLWKPEPSLESLPVPFCRKSDRQRCRGNLLPRRSLVLLLQSPEITGRTNPSLDIV